MSRRMNKLIDWLIDLVRLRFMLNACLCARYKFLYYYYYSIIIIIDWLSVVFLHVMAFWENYSYSQGKLL